MADTVTLFEDLPPADPIDGTEEVYIEQGSPPSPKRAKVGDLGFGRQPLSSVLSAISSAVVPAANTLIVFTSPTTAKFVYISPYVQSLLGAANSSEFQALIDIDPTIIAQINAGVAATAWAVQAAQEWARQAASAQAEVARLAAEVAANAAAFDLTGLNNQLSTLNARMGVAETNIATLQNLGFGATKVYADQAAMNADVGAQPDGTKAVTIADGFEWYKDPITHTWITFPGDRMTRLEARVDALDTPTRTPALNDGVQFLQVRTQAVAGTAETQWAAGATWSYSGGVMRLGRNAANAGGTNNHIGMLCKQLTSLKSKTVTIEMTFAQDSAVVAGVGGMSILLSPTLSALLPGGDYPAAGSCAFFTWRPNGTLLWYDGLITSTGGGGSTIPTLPGYGTGVSYQVGDQLRMTCRFDEQGTSFTVTLFVNGFNAGSWFIGGIPSSWFFGPGCRATYSNTYYDLTKFQVDSRNAGITRVYYMDPNAPNGGDGTRAKRFNDIRQLELALIQQAESAIVCFSSGTYRGGLRLPGDQFRRLEFQAEGSMAPIIDASTELLAAPGNWVRHDAVNYPNVWSRTLTYEGRPLQGGNGAVTELNVPSIRNGVQVLDYKIPKRVAPLTPQTEAWTSVNANDSTYWIDAVTQKIYFHATGSVDPNTKDYAINDRTFCLSVESPDRTGHYGCKVGVFGLTLKMSYSSTLQLDRCVIDIQNVTGYGSSTINGFAVNECMGAIKMCEFYGNGNDGINHSMKNTFPPYPERNASVVFYRNKCWYNGWTRFYPFTDPREYGDGTSNHTGATWVDFGGDYRYNGKCGTVPAAGTFYGYDLICVGNGNGNFQLGNSEAGIQNEMTLFRPISMDCLAGEGYAVYVTAPASASKAVMTLYDPITINDEFAFAARDTTVGLGNTAQLHIHNPKGTGWGTLTDITGPAQIVWHDPDELIPKPAP